MKFQFVVDRQGAAFFPIDTKLEYDPEDRTYFDTDCRKRGGETLHELFDELDLLKTDTKSDWKHHKTVVDIT